MNYSNNTKKLSRLFQKFGKENPGFSLYEQRGKFLIKGQGFNLVLKGYPKLLVWVKGQ